MASAAADRDQEAAPAPDSSQGAPESPGGTFLYAPVENRIEVRGTERTRPEAARRLIRGQHLDYGVWVDRSVWLPSWSPIEGPDLVFTPEDGSDSAAAFIEAQAGALPFQEMADAFISIQDKAQGNMTIEARELRRINGSDFLCVELSGTLALEPIRSIGCFFSNDVESISFIGFRKQAPFEKPSPELEDLVDGLVLSPSPSDGWPERPILVSPPRAKDAPAPLRVDPDSGVDPPVLRTRIEPVYPEEARRSRETGVAVLEGIIGVEGCVEDLKVLKATREPLLDDAALRAVRQWTYDPALSNGKPVSVYLAITVNFQLH